MRDGMEINSTEYKKIMKKILFLELFEINSIFIIKNKIVKGNILINNFNDVIKKVRIWGNSRF